MSTRKDERNRDARVYVGNLPSDIRQKELEGLFDKYGKITSVDLKNGAGRGPPFAFIEFEDYRDADDAIRGRNGYNFDGYSLRVEMPHGARGSAPPPRRGGPPRYDDRYGRGYGGGGGGYGRDSYGGGYDRGYGRGGYDRGSDRGYDRGAAPPRRSLSSRKTKYRVTISGLPDNCSWKDLKDHMRDAGEVVYADVRGASGVVEYENGDDMRYAVKNLDDTEIKTRDGAKAYIIVKEERHSSSRSRSRSPAKRRSASTDRKRSASPGRKRSASPDRKRSASPGRRRSKSPSGKRSTSPGGKRSASPRGKRSRSPGGKRSRSPGGKRSRSPGGKRSTSPGAKRSTSPRNKRSASPGWKNDKPSKKSPRRSSSRSRSPSQ